MCVCVCVCVCLLNLVPRASRCTWSCASRWETVTPYPGSLAPVRRPSTYSTCRPMSRCLPPPASDLQTTPRYSSIWMNVVVQLLTPCGKALGSIHNVCHPTCGHPWARGPSRCLLLIPYYAQYFIMLPLYTLGLRVSHNYETTLPT